MGKIKELVNKRTKLYSKFSDDIYEEAHDFLIKHDEGFLNVQKKNTCRYTSFFLAYFVCKKFLNRGIINDQDIKQKFLVHESTIDSNLNFLNLFIDLKNKKVVLLNDFVELLETNELKITCLSNCFQDILLAKQVLSYFNFHFKEEFYFEALAIMLQYHAQFLRPQIGTKNFKTTTTLDELLEFKKFFPKELDLISFSYSQQHVHLENMDKKIMKIPGYTNFFKDMKLNNFNLVNKLLQNYHPGHSQVTKKKIQLQKQKGAKLAHLIWDKQDLSQNFLDSFHKFYLGLKNHPDFFNLLEITKLDEMKAILKNVQILKKVGYADIFRIHTTKVMPGWSNNFVSKIRELIELDCNQEFPSFIDDQFAPRSTIKLKRELQFSSYKISQVVSLQQLKQIGHEFKNCLKENYGDENLTGGFSSFFIFRHDEKSSRNFILEVDPINQHSPVKEMLRKNNNEPTQENKEIAATFMVEVLGILPQEFILKFFENTTIAINEMNQKEAMEYLNNISPFLIFFLKRSYSRAFHDNDAALTSGHIKYIFENYIKSELGSEAEEYDYKKHLPLLTASVVQKDFLEDSLSWSNQTLFENSVLAEDDIPF